MSLDREDLAESDFRPIATATWAEFAWPDWVPERDRVAIAEFWAEKWGRGPAAWIHNHSDAEAPVTGTRVGVRIDMAWLDWVTLPGAPGASMHGRYLHCWNNIGRVITDDGERLYVSLGPDVVKAVRERAIAALEAAKEASHG